MSGVPQVLSEPVLDRIPMDRQSPDSEWKWPHARLAYLEITTRHHIISFFHNMIGFPLQSCTDLRQVCVYQY